MLEQTAFTQLLEDVKPFLPKQQLKLFSEHYEQNGSDDDWKDTMADYISILERFREILTTMPQTYDTEHLEIDDKVAYLHYFVGGCNWWIVEKDSEPEQLQAYGLVDLGYGPEFGYISITELIDLEIKHPFGFYLSVELDFYFQPTKLKNIPALADMFNEQ